MREDEMRRARGRRGGVFLARTERAKLLSFCSRFSFPVYTGCTHIDGEKAEEEEGMGRARGRDEKGAIVGGFVKIEISDGGGGRKRAVTATDHWLFRRCKRIV